MPNELDEIKALYHSNKKKIDYINSLPKSSIAKLPKETQEEIVKQTKKFADAETHLIRQGLMDAISEEPKSFQEAVENSLNNISYKGKGMEGQTQLEPFIGPQRYYSKSPEDQIRMQKYANENPYIPYGKDAPMSDPDYVTEARRYLTSLPIMGEEAEEYKKKRKLNPRKPTTREDPTPIDDVLENIENILLKAYSPYELEDKFGLNPYD